jgi:hypothetical protein
MAADNRDWYRDWWRKKTSYTEKAAFRISHGEHERAKINRAWRRNFLIAGGVVAAVGVTAALVRRRR